MVCKVLTLGRWNLFCLTCRLLQGKKVKNDHKNNIVVHSSESNIILHCHIKTHDGCIAGVKFLQGIGHKRVQLANALTMKNMHDLHVDSSHPSEVITHATTKSLGIKVTGTFNPCEDCTQGKAKKGGVRMFAVVCSKIFGERLFFDISSSQLPLLTLRKIGC